jgi:hypothetical protein
MNDTISVNLRFGNISRTKAHGYAIASRNSPILIKKDHYGYFQLCARDGERFFKSASRA